MLRTLTARLFGINRRASQTTLLDIRAVTPGQAVWTPADPEKQLREGYENAAWAYAAVNAILRAAKPTRWLAYQGDEELEQHEILNLLRRPNDEQSGAAFLEAAIGYYTTVGNTYIERVGAENGPPLELWVKRPDRMSVIPGGDRISGYEYKLAGQKYRFDPWQIRHIKTWSPLNDWYGLGAIQAAARGIDLFNVGQAQNLALMQNGARPTGAWTSDTTLTDTQFQRLKAEMREHADKRGRGLPLLLEAGVKWQEMGITPRELDWLAGQADAARQIHAAFGVHPVLTGLETGTYENQKQAMRGLLVNVVLPILDQIVEELNAWLAPTYKQPGLRINYDRDAYPSMSEDETALWDRGIRGYTQGLLTRDEARTMLGYGDASEGGDDFKQSGFGGLLAAPTPARTGKGRNAPLYTRAMTPAEAAEYRAARLKLQLAWEKRLTEWTAAVFDEERRAVTAALTAAGGPENAAAAIDATITPETFDGLGAWWLAAAYAGGKLAADTHGFTAPTKQRAEPLIPLEGQMMELWGILFQGALDKADAHRMKVVGEISETTRRALQELVRDGINEGLSIPNIADTIDTLYLEQIIPNRSTVIARTEVISSTNYGGQQAALATGLTLTKTWLATSDERTRDGHQEADGQTVNINEPYIVNGEALMFPGDPNGSAANIIQCRCSETYQEAEQ